MIYGFILILIGIALLLYLIKIKVDKQILSSVGIGISVILIIYGLIQVYQPNDDNYVKFTQTTISKQNQ